MKEKHILFISSWFPSRIYPFNGDFTQRHAKAISLLNKVTALHVEGDFSIDKMEIKEHQAEANYREIIIYFPKSKYRILNFFKKWKAYNLGVKKINDFDLIHANVAQYQMIWVVWQKIWKNKKYIISEHSSIFLGNERKSFSFFKSLILKIILNNASIISVVSNALNKGLEIFVKTKKIVVISNIIDSSLFVPKEKNNEKFTFLHLSNLLEVKNVKGILEAIRKLVNQSSEFIFKIGGNGDTSIIEEFRKENNLEEVIEVLPSLSHEEVKEQMQCSDCFVLFSNIETQGIVVLESFACGKPVISTRVGGVPENFPDGFGTLVEKNNIEELANAMQEMINRKDFASPNVMHKFVENKFSKEVISKQFNEVYNEVLGL